MSDFQTIADRVEIEALRGEFTDAAMMRDYDRLASLFTPDGALRMPKPAARGRGDGSRRSLPLGVRPRADRPRRTAPVPADPAVGNRPRLAADGALAAARSAKRPGVLRLLEPERGR